MNKNKFFQINITDMPTKFVNPLVEKLGGKWSSTKNGDHYLVDCDKVNDLPNMELHFGVGKIVISKDDYIWKYNVI